MVRIRNRDPRIDHRVRIVLRVGDVAADRQHAWVVDRRQSDRAGQRGGDIRTINRRNNEVPGRRRRIVTGVGIGHRSQRGLPMGRGRRSTVRSQANYPCHIGHNCDIPHRQTVIDKPEDILAGHIIRQCYCGAGQRIGRRVRDVDSGVDRRRRIVFGYEDVAGIRQYRQTIGDRDGIAIECDGSNDRQDAPIHGRTAIQGGANTRENMSRKLSACPQRRRTANLPVDLARITSVNHDHLRTDRRYKCAPDLEIEFRIRIPLGIENQRPGQLSR